MKSKLKVVLCVIIILMIHGFASPIFKFTNQNSTFLLSGSAAELTLHTPLVGIDGTIKTTNKTSTTFQGTTGTDIFDFSKGILQTSTGKSELTGTLSPTSSDTLILDGSKTLNIQSGIINENIQVKSTDNQIIGNPTFVGTIYLENNSAELEIGISNSLNQSITLNGGTLTLIDNLKLNDNIKINGNGTINVNNKTLTLPMVSTTAWNDNLTFENANAIELSGTTFFGGTTTFPGTGTSYINGNGNILDVSSGGIIQVTSGHTLYLVDLYLKGLGATGGDLSIDATSQVRLSNVTIELDGTYTQANGNIIVQSDNCRIVVREAEKFSISGATTSFTVDGVALIFDYLASTPGFASPFETLASGTLSTINDGIIRDAVSVIIPPIASSPISFSIPSITSDNDLTTSFTLGQFSTITLENSTPTSAKDMVLNGNGHIVNFNHNSGAFFILEDNVTLTTRNILLSNFAPDLVDLQGSGGSQAKIKFGDGTIAQMSKNVTINSPNYIEFTQDNSILDAQGHQLTLTGANQIRVIGTATGTIKNAIIKTTVASATINISTAGTLKLQNCLFIMDSNGFLFDTGNLEIKETVTINGSHSNTPGGDSIFSFQSSGNMKILTGSTLSISKGATIEYNPNITGDGGNSTFEKRHFSFTDMSSILALNNGSTLRSENMGLAFDHGTMEINGKAKISISTAAGAELELGSAMQVDVNTSGVMSVEGPLSYVLTTFP